MNQLTKAVKESRAATLSKITDEIRKDYLKKQKGKTVSVLFELYKDGYSEGYTENYTPVRIYTDKDYKGEIKNVVITDVGDDWCVGEIE